MAQHFRQTLDTGYETRLQKALDEEMPRTA
jgi:hypothetical protein